MLSGGQTSDKSTEPGVIEAILPSALYRVSTQSGRVVQAGLSSETRHQVVRLIAGDRVIVRLSTLDPNRGQIIKKL